MCEIAYLYAYVKYTHTHAPVFTQSHTWKLYTHTQSDTCIRKYVNQRTQGKREKGRRDKRRWRQEKIGEGRLIVI